MDLRSQTRNVRWLAVLGGPVLMAAGVLFASPWTGHAHETPAPQADKQMGMLGENTYKTQCSMCHQPTRQGVPPVFPSLVDVQTRLTDAQITDIIHNGRGRMPAQPNIEPTAMAAVIAYLKTPAVAAPTAPPAATPPAQFGNRTETVGALVYDKNCALCHGQDLLGGPSNYPGLVGVRNRRSDAQIVDYIEHGHGRMPAFPKLSEADTAPLLRFLGERTAAAK